MPRSGSMWLYNITREIVKAAGYKTLPEQAEPDPTKYYQRAYNKPILNGDIWILKNHDIIRSNLADTLIVSSYRDFREAITSYMVFMSADFEKALETLNPYLYMTDKYAERNSECLLISYERIVNHPLLAIGDVDRFVGGGLDTEKLDAIDEKFTLDKNKGRIANIDPNSKKVGGFKGTRRLFDNETGFQTNHITGSGKKWQQILTDEQKETIDSIADDWLKRYGYK